MAPTGYVTDDQVNTLASKINASLGRRLAYRYGVPTSEVTGPVMDLDAGVIYQSGKPGSRMPLLTAAESAFDVQGDGWWMNNAGTTINGGHLQVATGGGQAFLTRPVRPGTTVRLSVDLVQGTEGAMVIQQASGSIPRAHDDVAYSAPATITLPDVVVPAGITQMQWSFEKWSGPLDALFDNLRIEEIVEETFVTTTLGGAGGGNVVRVVANTDGSWPARPAAQYVEWVGPTRPDPTVMASGDTWSNTTA